MKAWPVIARRLLSGLVVAIGCADAAAVTVSGRVEAADTGRGIANVHIRISGENGGGDIVATTGPDGSYSASLAAVPAGVYRFSADPLFGVYAPQAYPLTDCAANCAPDRGQPFALPPPAPLNGIDFQLRRGGTLRVRVTDAATGKPLPSAHVRPVHRGGGGVYGARSDADGQAEFPLVTPGDYALVTDAMPGYVSEVYPDRPCGQSCNDVLAGGTVTVVSDARTDVDVGLDAGVGFSGRMLDTEGQPIPTSYAVVFDSTGTIVADAPADQDGRYGTVGVLPPGDYHLVAFSTYYVPTRYPSGHCFPCDPVSAVPAITVGSQSVSGLDFTLQRGSTITGALTWPGASWPMQRITATTLDGTPVWPALWIWEEHYELHGFPPGDYLIRVQAQDSAAYVGELYAGVPCYVDLACDLARGTPVHVPAAPATVPGIDLTLRADALFFQGFDTPAQAR